MCYVSAPLETTMHALHLMTNILLTGATGLIGGELLHVLLNAGVRTVWTAARPHRGRTAEIRGQERLRRSGYELDGTNAALQVVAGDIRQVGLGFSHTDRSRIQSGVDIIIHAASSTSFIRDEDC